MLVGIGVGVSLAVATIVVRVSQQPAKFRIERSTVIEAPASAVFGLVDDFHRWPAWSPWAKLDPAMTMKIEGAGVGSTYEWSGNRKVGAGRMTIVESQANRRVGLELQFLRPMKATNQGEFKFEPTGQSTRVTWSTSGSNDFMGKLFAFFVDMDKMVGGDFERGLAALKGLAEQNKVQSKA
jgi:hypothetical protein